MTRQQKIKHLEHNIGKVVISMNTGNVVVKPIYSNTAKIFSSIYAAHIYYYGY